MKGKSYTKKLEGELTEVTKGNDQLKKLLEEKNYCS
jgi:hypothetical protein